MTNQPYQSFLYMPKGRSSQEIHRDGSQSTLHSIKNSNNLFPSPTTSTFYFIYKSSRGTLDYRGSTYPLQSGIYFILDNAHANHLKGVEGFAVVRQDYKAMFMLGGPIEEIGRLKYIDGCTDSLLIPPIKMGDACLNHLNFPPNINQTMHTHPSIRYGMVVRGRGECVTPWGNFALEAGLIFAILPNDGTQVIGLDGQKYDKGSHCFRTFEEEGMDVIAYHPDSDFGAEDTNHPMINRTIIGDVSANSIIKIQTK